MPTYYSPTGNPEIWDERPSADYMTPEEWEAAHPFVPPDLTLEEAKAQVLARLTASTRATILGGFGHSISGNLYHFGYDDEDQGNFAKANSAALLALVQQDSEYSQVWRGWFDGEPKVFRLSVEEYLALSRAGADHQLWWQQRFWEKEAAVKAASSFEELDAIVI